MRIPKRTIRTGFLRQVATASLAATVVMLGTLGVNATTRNVTTDPSSGWNGYWNAFATNGTLYQQQYLGGGTSFPNQSSIDSSGTVTIAPDIYADITYPNDTTIWADASGTSAGIANIVSTFYSDNTSFSAGDTVIYSGTLVSNALVAPYAANAVAFIKDFGSDWSYKGISSVNLSTLTNGQAFSVTWGSVSGSGDHIQWGIEWSGPPARQATVASLGYAMVSTNGAVPSGPKTVNVSIDHNQFWAAYQTINGVPSGVPYATGYLGADAANIQGSITGSDVVRCAPDLRADILAHANTDIWADATGLSDANPGVTADSTYYVDVGGIAATGDTVVFSGQIMTNNLVDPYSGAIVAFIKDFDAGWGWFGQQTVHLSEYTNGQTFSVSKVIAGGGAHIQYGF